MDANFQSDQEFKLNAAASPTIDSISNDSESDITQEPLRITPLHVICGEKSLVKCLLLNNKRSAVTVDEDGLVHVVIILD